MQETARYLPEFGVEVGWFNQWEDFPYGKYDLVHLFGAHLLNYDIAFRLHQFGVPFVVSSIYFTMRSPAFIRGVRRLATIGSRFFNGLRADYTMTADICDMSQMVLPNTTAEAEILIKGMGAPSTKVKVVPNGVDPRFADADPSLFIETYGIKDFVLNVGHIGTGRKNVLNLVRAMKDIEHPLVVIGKVQQGSYADAILEEAKANPRITIIEGLPNDSPMLASAYAACKVFAFPSLFETPGIAALEAGLAGAKVVITPHGGTRDYFRDEAIYVEPTSVESIKRGIEQSLKEPTSALLRDRILREYTWKSIAEKTATVYRDVLG